MQVRCIISLKVIISLSSCSASRAVHLELVSNLSSTNFIKIFKKLISRRKQAPYIQITQKPAGKWLNSINRDEQFPKFFVNEKNTWKFNPLRISWWVGKYERLIELIKQGLYKSIGKSLLTFSK